METASFLRTNRLLTSSLRFEPTFKHDDPDEPDLSTKKGRRVAAFSFEKLLPLMMTREEMIVAIRLKYIVLENVSGSTFLARRRRQSLNEEKNEKSGKEEEFVFITPKEIVFFDLWNRGLCMVDGLKFGVDYLAYVKDPLRFHAELMILVNSNEEQSNSHSNLDLTTMCTVAAKTRKTLIIATVHSMEVSYTRFKREPIAITINKRAKQSEEEILEEIPSS